MIRDKIKKLTLHYDSLNSKSKLFVTIGLVLILALLVKGLSLINLKKGIIDYSWNSGEEIVSDLSVCTDKSIYLKSNEIVKKIIQTANNEYIIENKKVSINDWLKYVKYDEYKVSKKDFTNKIKNIGNEFNDEVNNYGSKDLIYDSTIEKIYMYSEAYELYVIKFNIGEHQHYLGIKFESDNFYHIFYIE